MRKKSAPEVLFVRGTVPARRDLPLLPFRRIPDSKTEFQVFRAGSSGDTLRIFFGFGPRTRVSFPVYPTASYNTRTTCRIPKQSLRCTRDITECAHPLERGNDLSMVAPEFPSYFSSPRPPRSLRWILSKHTSPEAFRSIMICI